MSNFHAEEGRGGEDVHDMRRGGEDMCSIRRGAAVDQVECPFILSVLLHMSSVIVLRATSVSAQPVITHVILLI